MIIKKINYLSVILIISFFITLLFGEQTRAKKEDEIPVYKAVEEFISKIKGEEPKKGVLNKNQILKSIKIDKEVIIDGEIDEIWEKNKGIYVWDYVAKINILLKSYYTDEMIYFLVIFNDPDESREHKAWVWNEKEKIYVMNEAREDVFVFKWNMAEKPVDLSIYADEPYITDIWFWKAERTDPVGYADDKIDRLSNEKLPKATEIESKSSKKMYLLREPDKGKSAFETKIYVDYQGDKISQYKYNKPEGSSADILAKGKWTKGKWVIEFGRKLKTGNDDDVQFETDKKYQFGVSRYEIAGRKPDTKLSQPLYGCGDVYNSITLIFEK